MLIRLNEGLALESVLFIGHLEDQNGHSYWVNDVEQSVLDGVTSAKERAL